MKKFFGGIFVLLHIALGLFFSLEGLITPFEPSIGVIITVWCLFAASAIMYPIGRSVYKTQDFTMMTGYDPKKKYNKPVYAEFYRQVTVWWCFFGFLFSVPYLFYPLMGANELGLLTIFITGGYTLGLFISYGVLYYKYKDRILIKEGEKI